MSNWQPMDTAPRNADGQIILLCVSGHPEDYDSSIYLGFWGSAYGDRADFWCDWGSGLIAEFDGHEEFFEVPSPAFWQPLPAPPCDRDGTATAAANGDLPVPKDCQARPEGIAQ